MKHNESEYFINIALEKFEELKRNPKYLADYKQIKQLEQEAKPLKKRNLKMLADKHPDAIKGMNEYAKIAGRRLDILKRWDLRYEANPNWKINKKILMRSFKLGGTVEVFLFAFLGRPMARYYLASPIKKGNPSQDSIDKDRRVKKFLCSMFINKLKMSARMVARLFGVDHKTITSWLDEVDDWSPANKEKVGLELRTAKNLFKSNEAMNYANLCGDSLGQLPSHACYNSFEDNELEELDN